MDLEHTVVVALCLCLVSHGIAVPGQGNICQKKCKECNECGVIGPCVSECVKSGNPEGYDCFDQCNGEGGGNNCDVKTTNCVDTAKGFTCECKDQVKVRLAGGKDSREGRVEVSYCGVWGTVCSDFWDNQDAQVVCRELGLPNTDAVAKLNAYFGPGEGAIHLDSIACDGTESRLTECNNILGWGNHNCDHGDDASVICQDVP